MKTKLLTSYFIIGLFLIGSSCKKEDAPITYSLNKENVTLTSKKTFRLTIEGRTTEIFEFSTDNDLIASVESNGLITGERVGETAIKVIGMNFNGECIVTVFPLYNTFKEPITSFGSSLSQVKSKETRVLLNENETGLLYEGGTLESFVMYLFENNKLTGSVVVLSSDHTSELASYMIERYVIVSASPVMALSIDNKFGVGTELRPNLDWWVVYFPNPNSGKKAEIIQSQLLKFQNLLKVLLK